MHRTAIAGWITSATGRLPSTTTASGPHTTGPSSNRDAMNIKRLICLLSLALAASVAPARASSISLVLSGTVSPGSSFDIAVKVNDVFAGRAADDVLLGYGFNVTIGNGAVVQYLSETAGPLFDDLSVPGVTAAGI